MRCYDSRTAAPLANDLIQIVCENLGVRRDQVTDATSFLKDVGKKNQALQTMLPQLIREEPGTIGQKLQDPDPLVRWVAIQVAAQKWTRISSTLS